MNDTVLIYTKESVLTALAQVDHRVDDFFESFTLHQLFHPPAESWSPAQNLEHLIRSVRPLARAMRLPRVTLRLLFGTPGKPSRSYCEIQESYLLELSNGARATGKFLPEQTAAPGPDLETARTELLEKWRRASEEFRNTLGHWDESQLDQYALPHPILGSLTIREMLFFTIYHNSRHATPEGD